MEIFREKKYSEINCRTMTPQLGVGKFHWHEKIEICQIKSERCSFFIDKKRIDAHRGDIVFMGEYIVHSFVSDKEDTLVRLCQFPISVIMNTKTPIKPIKPHITAEEIKNHDGLSGQIDFLFDLLEKEPPCKNLSENPFLSSLSASLYFLLLRHFPSTENETKGNKGRYEFYLITEYINNHFFEDINVNSIAKELCISRTKLSTLFSKYAETNLNSYINALRISYANQLIESGSEITDAAFESGFQSVRTFNEVYKRTMHMSPREYLKRNSAE